MTTTPFKRVYDVGDVYPSVVNFRTFAGLAEDPPSVTFDWISPSQAVTWTHGVDPEIIHDDDGDFHAGVPLTASGQWKFGWNGLGDDPETDLIGVANAIITVRPAIASVFLAITPDELETFMQRQLDPDTARECIADITGEAEAIMHRGIGGGTRTEQHDFRRGSTYVIVDGGPITTVSEVILDGETLVSGTSYSWDRNGIMLAPPTSFSSSMTLPTPSTLSVTFNGGITKSTRLPNLKSVIKARCARRLMMNKEHVNGLTSLGVEGTSLSFMPDAFTETELAILKANSLPASAVRPTEIDGSYIEAPFWFNNIPRGGGGDYGY